MAIEKGSSGEAITFVNKLLALARLSNPSPININFAARQMSADQVKVPAQTVMDIEPDKREAMVFAASLVQQVNREDVANMVQVQRGMLQRFEKTNEMLINFNQLSFSRYEASVQDFQKHTQLLFDMKKDLDSIFKRIRVLKQRLSKSYPDAFAACSSVIMVDDDILEDDLNSQPSTSSSAAQPTGSAVLKPADADGSASKTRIVRPQKPTSASKSRDGGTSSQPVRKSSRLRMESKQTTRGIKSESPHTSGTSSSGQFKSKPL